MKPSLSRITLQIWARNHLVGTRIRKDEVEEQAEVVGPQDGIGWLVTVNAIVVSNYWMCIGFMTL